MYLYDDLLRSFFYNVFAHSTGVKKIVKHHQTCPVCLSTLVNLYKRNDKWQCKKCWDMHDELKSLWQSVPAELAERIGVNYEKK